MDNPLDEAGSFTVTSDLLPVAEFPQFRSWASGAYAGASGRARSNRSRAGGTSAALHADDSYMRLSRTVDLTAVAATDSPTLRFALSFDTEASLRQRHRRGAHPGHGRLDDAARDGRPVRHRGPGRVRSRGSCSTSTRSCEHYLTPGRPLHPNGTSGAWNRMTGNSGGWQQVGFDLSAYAGQQVEVSISYVTDSGAGGVGRLRRRHPAGGRRDRHADRGFRDRSGRVVDPRRPRGEPRNTRDFRRAQTLVAASVSTPDSVMFGFGVEQVADPAQRADLLGRVVKGLVAKR